LRRAVSTVGAVFVSLTLAVAGMEVAACSGSSSPPAMAMPNNEGAIPLCTDGGLQVAFPAMYSAYVPGHTFQIPALVVGSNTNVTWSADSKMVGMQTDNERPNEVLITALQAGTVAINVQSADGKCGSSILTIDQATESDWMIGNARYNNGQSLHLQAGATGGTGSPLESGGTYPACTNCHGETATNSAFTNVSHTPEQTGGFSDDEILNIVLHGTFPPGAYFDTNIVPYVSWMTFHRWADITADQQKGIIVYLRSLTPAPQKGNVNFGAFDTDASGVAADDGETDAGESNSDATVDAAPDAGSGPDAEPDVVTVADDAAADAPPTDAPADN
jgi:hypothetical protein